MNAHKPMQRLLALRLIEEERDEAKLRKQHQLRQACVDALEASKAREVLASQALHAALDSGDRTEAISAEMALACGPLERRTLEQRLEQLDAMVERTSVAWQGSRVRRLQMETLVQEMTNRIRKEAQTRQQKTLDGWFLSSRPKSSLTLLHKNSQREVLCSAERCGTARADDEHE